MNYAKSWAVGPKSAPGVPEALFNFHNEFVINGHPIGHEPFSAGFLVPVHLRRRRPRRDRDSIFAAHVHRSEPVQEVVRCPMSARPRIDDHIGAVAISDFELAQVERPALERVHAVGDVCPLRRINRDTRN